MKHQYAITNCRNRAEASLAQSVFIQERCQAFDLVCPHTPSENALTGVVTPGIHVYDEDVAKREFGDTCWIEVPRPDNSQFKNEPKQFAKLVDGISVSYDRLP